MMRALALTMTPALVLNLVAPAMAQDAVNAIALLSPCQVAPPDIAAPVDRFMPAGWVRLVPLSQTTAPDWFRMAALLVGPAVADLTTASAQTEWVALWAAPGELSECLLLDSQATGQAEQVGLFHDPVQGSLLVVVAADEGREANIRCTLVVSAAAARDAMFRPVLAPATPGGFALDIWRATPPLAYGGIINMTIIPDPAAFQARLGVTPDVGAAFWTQYRYRIGDVVR